MPYAHVPGLGGSRGQPSACPHPCRCHPTGPAALLLPCAPPRPSLERPTTPSPSEPGRCHPRHPCLLPLPPAVPLRTGPAALGGDEAMFVGDIRRGWFFPLPDPHAVRLGAGGCLAPVEAGRASTHWGLEPVWPAHCPPLMVQDQGVRRRRVSLFPTQKTCHLTFYGKGMIVLKTDQTLHK